MFIRIIYLPSTTEILNGGNMAVPKITLLQAFEQITTIITELKNGRTTADLASANLTSLVGRVNSEIPGVAFKVPSEDELKAFKVPSRVRNRQHYKREPHTDEYGYES